MALTVHEVPETNILQLEAVGKLEKKDYDQFVPLTEALIKKYGKIRVLFIMRDFHGWEAGALWEDIKFDVAHFNDVERVAMVGDSKWESGMAKFCKPFTTASVKYFDLSEEDAARAWLTA